MESNSITVNPIIEQNNDLHVEEGVQYLDDPIKCDIYTNIMTCLCVMGCLFMVFIMLGGYYILAAGGSNDPA